MTRVLVVNPWASRVDERRLADVRAALPDDTELRMTSARGEATEIARAVSGEVEALYVFGGDGTFNEVLNGIDATTPVGFVPGGGTSVLPRALGLPRDARESALRIASGTSRRIGVGRVNGRRFGFCAGIGFDAEIVRAVDERGRSPDGRRPGDLAFLWSGFRTLARYRFKLEPELEVVGHGRAVLALVSNSPVYSYAGGLAVRITPEASFEGGLDLVAPAQLRGRDVSKMLAYAFGRGAREGVPDLIHAHDADGFEIVCDRPLALQADGEDLGDVEHAVFEAERDAVTVLA